MMTLDEIIARKEDLIDSYDIIFTQLIQAKAKYLEARSLYMTKKVEILNNDEELKTTKKTLKDQIEAIVESKMPVDISLGYQRSDFEVKQLELKLDHLRAVSKELSDIIVLNGIKNKVTRLLEGGTHGQ